MAKAGNVCVTVKDVVLSIFTNSPVGACGCVIRTYGALIVSPIRGRNIKSNKEIDH